MGINPAGRRGCIEEERGLGPIQDELLGRARGLHPLTVSEGDRSRWIPGLAVSANESGRIDRRDVAIRGDLLKEEHAS